MNPSGKKAVLVRRSVVELDLVGYSHVARTLEQQTDATVLMHLNDQVQRFVDDGLREAGCARKDVVNGTAGDNALLVFERASEAHRFSEAVHRATAAHNTTRSDPAAQRHFRIGISTGEIAIRGKAISGTRIIDSVRLEAAGKKGHILVDEATFEELPAKFQRHYRGPETVGDKQQNNYRVYRFAVTEPDTSSPRTPNTATRRQLLERVQSDQVDSRLGQGLREAIRVDLHLTETLLRLKMYVFSDESVPPKNRATSEPIANIFANSSGSLAILGHPGTGKTNLLLELAGDLITDAERHPERPIPIVFSLARWTLVERSRPLDEWMIEELKSYDVSAKAAEALVHQDGLLPLLDGLDEVAADRREACVRSIRNYQNGPRDQRRIALCCRLEEYERLLVKPDIKTEVRVELLTGDDVDREICKPGLDHVRLALAADPALRSVIQTPLWLHVLFLAAHVESIHDQALAPMDRLFAQYVRYALQRDPAGLPRNRTDSNSLLLWLGCLATEMRRRSQSQFTIDDLNFSWFTSQLPERPLAGQGVRAGGNTTDPANPTDTSIAIRVAQRVSFGLITGMIGWLMVGWVFGLVIGLIPAMRVEGRIEASEDLRFDWRQATSRVPFSLVYGLVFGLTFGATDGWVGGLCLGLAAATFEALQGGFQPRSVSRNSAPNLKTRRSLYYAVRIAAVGVVFAALLIIVSRIGSSFGIITAESGGALLRVAFLIVLGAVILGCEKGGWFAARHYLVRFMLWRRGYAPLAYVRFLDETTERLFLVRRGSNYEFLHVTFRDYMAKTYGPGSPNATQAAPSQIKAGQLLYIA